MGIMVCQVFFPNQTTGQINHHLIVLDEISGKSSDGYFRVDPSGARYDHYHPQSYTTKLQPQLKQLCTSLLTVLYMDGAASHIAMNRKK